MKRKVDIVHINHNSPGTEGLYENGIFEALEDRYNQELWVNSLYPLPNGRKLFFRVSNALKLPNRSIIIKGVKFFELIIDWVILYIHIYRTRPKLVNLSLISRFMLPERLFVKFLCRLKGVKVALTCHDVIPFGDNKEELIKKRKPIINSVDYLIIHSISSKQDLISVFNADSDKILHYPHPLIDFEKLFTVKEKEKSIDFLFTGFIRKAKGLYVLLEAWKKYHVINPVSKLVIAGAIADDDFKKEDYGGLNIEFKLYFLSPKEYVDTLYKTKCVVLPYIQGTNSGILYSAVAANCLIITSDIPMFKNNLIVEEKMMFKSEDTDDLCRLMLKTIMEYSDYSSRKEQYALEYNKSIHEAYAKMLNS